MTYVRVSGFKIFKDRHGKQRCYHRKTGIKIDLERAPVGSAAFIAECEKITALMVSGAGRGPKPGTLGGLVSVYFGIDHFSNLSPTTRRDYRQCAAFLEPIFDTPVVKIDTPLLSRIHDRASEKIGWRRANMVRTFLSEVFRHCVPRGLIDRNYVIAVIPKARPKGLARANRPWTDDECRIVMELAPLHIKAVIAVMMFTGIDPSDALALRRLTWPMGLSGASGERPKPILPCRYLMNFVPFWTNSRPTMLRRFSQAPGVSPGPTTASRPCGIGSNDLYRRRV